MLETAKAAANWERAVGVTEAKAVGEAAPRDQACTRSCPWRCTVSMIVVLELPVHSVRIA